MKICPRCHANPVTRTRADGRPASYCDPCARAHNARYDRRSKRIKPYVPAHVPDPLNSLLRDMPGSRVSLLGIAGVRTTAESRAA